MLAMRKVMLTNQKVTLVTKSHLNLDLMPKNHTTSTFSLLLLFHLPNCHEIYSFSSSSPNHHSAAPYEITIWTGKEKGSGTDANVFVQIYGEEGKKTDEITLDDKSNNFESGTVNKFKVRKPVILFYYNWVPICFLNNFFNLKFFLLKIIPETKNNF